jgi:hypothetical protein
MSDTKRYDEDEIAEILELATTSEGAVQPGTRGSGEGLTLEQVQEIGSEVGITPARISDAARTMASRNLVGKTKTFLGAPRSVSRIVPIDRALNDDEWSRLVVDLRQTFDALGKVATEGNLRVWRNGNLHVYVEPDGDRYRVRMRTHKGNITPRMAMATGFILMSMIFVLQLLFQGADLRSIMMGTIFGAIGGGAVAVTRASLPGWALERTAQMEGLAERIPLLLKE